MDLQFLGYMVLIFLEAKWTWHNGLPSLLCPWICSDQLRTVPLDGV